jgi:hypothetical protein
MTRMNAQLERLPAPSGPPDIDERFLGGPDPLLWVPEYLPHWTTPDRSAARYESLPGGGVQLRIDADQPDWRPEDAPLRVSNLQTGTYSGPVGSLRGTHRHRDDGLVVRTETPRRLLWAPSGGRIDVTVSASLDEHCMLAAWLVGTEHEDADDSGEICIFEIDADAVGARTVARCGVKGHHDPRLVTDMTDVVLPLDASAPHTWSVVWGEGETLIACEGVPVRRIRQSPTYPMFLMLDLFEIGTPSGRYPKTASVHRVQAWDAGSRGITGDTPGRRA